MRATRSRPVRAVRQDGAVNEVRWIVTAFGLAFAMLGFCLAAIIVHDAERSRLWIVFGAAALVVGRRRRRRRLRRARDADRPGGLSVPSHSAARLPSDRTGRGGPAYRGTMPSRIPHAVQAAMDEPFPGYAWHRRRWPALDADRVVACVALLGVMVLGGTVLGSLGGARHRP